MWAQNAEFPENNLTSVELSQKWFLSFSPMAAVIEEKHIPHFHFYTLENHYSGPSRSLEIHQSWSFCTIAMQWRHLYQQKMRKFSRIVVHPNNDLKMYFLKMLFTLTPNAK